MNILLIQAEGFLKTFEQRGCLFRSLRMRWRELLILQYFDTLQKEDHNLRMVETTICTSKASRFLFTDTRSAPLWLILRIYLGYEWLMAGWAKLHNPAWIGDQTGTAITGFLKGALQKVSGDHPDVSLWYAYFIEHVALEHTTLFSYLVVYGEILVGLALIIGVCVGVSAFFGAFMNYNFLLAGSVSVNPIMLLIAILLILSWRVAGWLGADQFILPHILRLCKPKQTA